ncbi:MAG: class I SAM-dependent methyltransferase [candidate division Zixibacteria bacterium]|nr:class I SAM-dependent methyltransferase [candidate division Zixibacteria bacterium]
MPVQDLIEEMNAYYARRAPWHDSYMNYTTPEAMEKLLAPIIDIVERYLKDRNVLEIACGTGNWTRVLAGRARSVTATDVSKEHIKIAREKNSDIDKVTYAIIDAYKINELPGEFEIAFAADFWSHIPKSMITPFLEKLHRKVKKKGWVIFLDMLYRKEFDKDGFFYDDEGNRINKRTLPDGSRFRVVKNFPTREELEKQIAGYATHAEYIEDRELMRWLLIYNLK